MYDTSKIGQVRMCLEWTYTVEISVATESTHPDCFASTNIQIQFKPLFNLYFPVMTIKKKSKRIHINILVIIKISC